jgi:hypothetical protein
MSRRIVTLIATALGLALLAWQVHKAGGPGEIFSGFRQIGPAGFALILAATLVRQLCRTFAWMLLMDAKVPLRTAFAATMSGDAIGNLTPLSLLASEPAKAMFVRAHLPTPRALAALAAENFLYSLSVAIAVLIGVAVLFFEFPYSMHDTLRTAAFAIVVGMTLVLAVALWLIARQPALVSSTLGRFVSPRVLGKIRDLETTTYGFVRSRPASLLGVLGCEVTFHLASIAEAWITLRFLGVDSLPLAVVLDTVQRVITIVFKIVPLRAGVDEWGSGSITEALDQGLQLGVTMALIRKIRVLIWSGMGLAIIASRKSEDRSGK